MEFSIEKCAMHIIKSWKRQKTIRTFEEKENYKYTGRVKADTIKQMENLR